MTEECFNCQKETEFLFCGTCILEKANGDVSEIQRKWLERIEGFETRILKLTEKYEALSQRDSEWRAKVAKFFSDVKIHLIKDKYAIDSRKHDSRYGIEHAIEVMVHHEREVFGKPLCIICKKKELREEQLGFCSRECYEIFDREETLADSKEDATLEERVP